jgi:hypothetical protein
MTQTSAESGSGPWMDGFAQLQSWAILATWSLRLISESVSSKIVFDAEGPEKVRLYFRDDGVIIFEFPSPSKYSGGEIPKYQLDPGNRVPQSIEVLIDRRDSIRDQRARYVNGLLACFNAAIRPTNAFTPPLTKANYMVAYREGSQWSVRNIAPPWGSPGVPNASSRAFTVPSDELRRSVELFCRMFDLVGEVGYDLLNLLYRAAFLCSQHDFQGSVALAWTVIEKAQNILWDRFLRTGYKTVNPNTQITGRRRKLLMGSRDYTASVRSQVLSLAQLYSDDELNGIDKVRGKRNAFMHNLEAVAPMDASNAIVWALHMIGKVLGTEFFFSPTYASWDTND